MMRCRQISLLLGLTIALAASLSPAQEIPEGCLSRTPDVGLPTYRVSPPPHVILCRMGYVLAHNEVRRIPDWVMETLTTDNLTVRTSRRRLGNPFAADPDIRRTGRPHAKLFDYRNSGCDRGHMAPAADMAWDATAMRESFYLSNIAPQEGPDFNRGIWADLESAVRDWLRARGKLVVITGPIFDGGERDEATQKAVADNRHCQKERIGDAIDVPNRFFKIIYDPERQRVIAFVLPNRRLKREDVKSYRESVDRIEALTGVDFLTGLPARTQRILKTRKASMWRQSE